MPEYLGKHVIGIPQHVMIPEPKHAIPRAFQDLGTSQIVLARVCMLPAVEFDDQPDLAEVNRAAQARYEANIKQKSTQLELN